MPFTSRTKPSSATAVRPRRPPLRFLVCKDLPLLLDSSLEVSVRKRILASISGLPELTGNPLVISTLPALTAHRGKLLSSVNQGTPVHAASFIRRREIVFETELLKKPDLPSILVHELFHFVWVRLGNAKRTAYTAFLAKELRARARGELGESAAVRKQFASGSRDYVCESFCDTAAWLYAPNTGSSHVNLGQRWQRNRKAWFEANFQGPVKC